MTMHNRFTKVPTVVSSSVLSGAILFALSGAAAAQDDGLLSGAEVVESSGFERGPGHERMGLRGDDGRLGAYLRAVRTLRVAGDVDDALALSDEQGEQIREIARSHGEAMKSYLHEHRDELELIRSLRGDQAQRGGQGEKLRGRLEGARRANRAAPGAERGERMNREQRFGAGEGEGRGRDGRVPVDPEVREMTREMMQELMSGAPTSEGAIEEIRSVLSADQQAFVDMQAEKMREKRDTRQARRGERRAGQKSVDCEQDCSSDED